MMALSDLAVFSEYTYTALTEVLAQNVELFNAATQNALVLRVEAMQGDYSDTTFYAALAGIVRRRNPYGDGAIAEKVLSMKIDTMVKVASGTAPVRMDPAWFAWIQRNPEEAAAVLAQQIAKQALADMLNVAVESVTAALSNAASMENDISGGNGTAALPSPLALGNTAIKLGDRMSEIVCWIMHSKSWNDLYGNALTNNERLFVYGNVNVSRDPMGRVYVMADQPALMTAAVTGQNAAPAKFHTLGLVPGAVDIAQNDDFFDNWSTTNGNENIHRTYQSEWSYNVGVKGFAWDKTNGGHAPSDAALSTAASWDQVCTSLKDGPGVIMISQ